MGWAKYYEDNINIYEERLAVRAAAEEERCECRAKSIKYTPKPRVITETKPRVNVTVVEKKEIKANTRSGLELSFYDALEENNIRKLQMNGWWWSKSKACWCNSNTEANKRYVETYLKNFSLKIFGKIA